MEDEVIQQPEIIEVDSMDQFDSFDGDNAMYDDAGNVTRYQEDGKTYVLKGTQETENQDGGGEPDTDPNKEKQDSAPEAKGDKPESKAADSAPGDEEEADEDDDFEGNAAEYILKKIGYEKDEIDFGDGPKKIKDLTVEEQLQVATQEFKANYKQLTDKITELENAKPEAQEVKLENPQHQQIVDYLKNGGDIQKLAKEIISKDPAAQAKIMTDDEVVKAGIKKEFPEYSEEEVDEEFSDLKDGNKIARRAKVYRSRMEKEGIDVSSLTQEQQAAKEAALHEAQDSFKAEAQSVIDHAKTVEKIGEIKVNDQVKQFLLSQVLPKSYDEDSAFIQGLNSPDKLMRLAFLDNYHEKILQQSSEYHYQRGLKESKEKLEKFSDEPVKLYGGTNKKGKQNPGITTIEDIKDFDAFANADGF